jgi:hypothetical protein
MKFAPLQISQAENRQAGCHKKIESRAAFLSRPETLPSRKNHNQSADEQYYRRNPHLQHSSAHFSRLFKGFAFTFPPFFPSLLPCHFVTF